MTERNRERGRQNRSSSGPVETMFGAAFGPFGATVRSVFDANRVAFSIAFGPAVSGVDEAEATEGLDGGTTIEIEDTSDERENEAANASGGADPEPESESESESDGSDVS